MERAMPKFDNDPTDEPNDPLAQPTILPGWEHKRGKHVPPPMRSANGRGGMGQEFGPDMVAAGLRVLSEAKGSGD
jgi:hypothetical protein